MSDQNLSKAQTLGVSREKQAPPPPPQPSSPINFCILAFFHLKYDILYAWSYTGVRKNDLEHMENIWKKCILLTMIEKTIFYHREQYAFFFKCFPYVLGHFFLTPV